MLSKILRGAVLATFAVGATVAQADPFWNAPATEVGTLKFDGAANGYRSVNVTNYGPNGSGGEFKGSFSPTNEIGPSVTASDDFFRFFCIQLSQVAGGTQAYTRYQFGASDDPERLTDTTTRANQLSWLFDKYYPNKSSGNFLSNSPFGDFSTGTPAYPDATDASAAMQLAIWEIMFESRGSLDLNGGTFTADTGTNVNALGIANSSTITATSGMLAYVSAHSGAAKGWTFYRFNSTDAQDFLSATYASGDENRVPLPGTLALFGIGLAGLGLARRKS
jgi:hypothetical protein